MSVCVEVGGGDLESTTNCKVHPPRETKTTHDKSRSHEVLFHAAILVSWKIVELNSTSGQHLRERDTEEYC